MAERWRLAVVAAALAVVAAAAVAACTSSHGAARRSSALAPPTSAVASSTGPARATACGTGAHAFLLHGPAHSVFEANAVGAGRDAVVFLHETGPTGMCGFWPYARWLSAHRPVLAVLVNRCGYGASSCSGSVVGDAGIVTETKPAVDWARSRGATRVTLVGASAGASDALEAAGVVPGVDAVVDLSGDFADTAADDRVSARRLRVPALFAVAPQDGYSPVAAVRAVYGLVPSRPKRLVVVTSMPGAHGWDLLFDPAGTKVTPLARVVAAWIVGRIG